MKLNWEEEARKRSPEEIARRKKLMEEFEKTGKIQRYASDAFLQVEAAIVGELPKEKTRKDHKFSPVETVDLDYNGRFE